MSSRDWLADERARHGPVTAEQIAAGYDALLDAWEATRQAEIRGAPDHPDDASPLA